MPAVDDWSTEYDAFCKSGKRFLDTAASLQRVKRGADFLRAAGDDDISLKINFLKYKDLVTSEIEQVLEEVLGSTKPGVVLAFLNGELNKVQQQEDKEADSTYEAITEDCLWVVGQQVYAYAGDYTYLQVPIQELDKSRHGDPISVAFLDSNGLWGNHVWLPEGHKGIVADIFPCEEHITFGTPVIAAVDTLRDAFQEATVVEILGSDQYVVEFSTTGKNATLGHTDIRTIMHPKYILQRRSQDEANAANVRTKLYVSGATFEVGQGAKDRSARVEEIPNTLDTGTFDSRKVAASTCITDNERYTMKTHVKGFGRYPPLDVEGRMSHVRTFADFIRVYGVTPFGSNDHVVPTYPGYQQSHSGVGFGADLSRHERYRASRLLFTSNPVLDICTQCFRADSMFVDPDFPPSRYSLYGAKALSQPLDADDLEWRRLSEVLHFTCITAASSNSWGLVPGYFDNTWIPYIVASLPQASEFEYAFSPSDGSNHYGCYVVKVFINTEWLYVVIDDFVPVHKETGALASLVSKNEAEIYPVLVEKVLAKLEGSYSALQQAREKRHPCRAWEMLSGGMAETSIYTLLSDRNGWIDNLKARDDEKGLCIMLSRTHGEEGKVLLRGVANERDFARMGLTMGACSFLKNIASIEYGGSMKHFVLCANPFSAVQGSALPDSVPEDVLNTLQTMQTLLDPGRQAVWLAFSDYMRYHEYLLTCWHFSSYQKCAVYGSFEKNCGGSLFSHEEQFFDNNQYMLRLFHNSFITAELSLMDRKFTENKAPDGLRLQLHLFRAEEPDQPLPKGSRGHQLFTSNMIDLVDDEDAKAYPTVHLTTHLHSGLYVLIPDIGTTHSTEAFSMKVWSNANFTIRLVNS